MKTVILQVFYVFFSGLMMSTAIPNEILPFGSPFIALFSLIPVYIAMYRAKSYKETYLYMAVHALTVHLVSSFWLAYFRNFAVFTLGASAIGTAAEAGLIGIIFHILPEQHGKAFNMEENSGKHSLSMFSRILWFCAIWVSWEWMKSTGFLAYPWGTMYTAAYKWKIFTQISDITGVWGVTFIYVLFSAVAAEGLMIIQRIKISPVPYRLIADYRQCIKFAVVVFLTAGLYGVWQYFTPRAPEKHINTIAVQQNIDPWETKENISIEISKTLTEQALISMQEQGLIPDLVLWSEGILQHSFPSARFYYQNNPEGESLSAFIARMGVPFIIGGITFVNPEKKHYSNSAILFDKDGTYSGFYSKMHLVPFAEAIPFSDTEIMRWLTGNLFKFSSSFTQGKQYVLFSIPLNSSRYDREPLEYRNETHSVISLNDFGISNPDITWNYILNPDKSRKSRVCFTTPICFEDAFPEVCSKLHGMGSEIFLNITNDSWSKTISAEYQHFAIASYLAIEYRTTLLRCTNSGYSAVIDPAGKIIDSLDIFKQDVMCTKVPVFKYRNTVFSLFGDWFVFVIFAIVLIYIFFTVWKIRKDDIKAISIHRIIKTIEQLINNI